jgi:hypothetical protein
MEGVVQFWLKEILQGSDSKIRVIDAAGREAIEFVQTKPLKDGQSELKLAPGWNRLAWNLRYPAAETFDGMVLWGGGTGGPLAAPGSYKILLELGDLREQVELQITKSPRSEATNDDLIAQFDFLLNVRDKLTEIHGAIKRIRQIRNQLQDFGQRFREKTEFAELVKQSEELIKAMTAIEEELYQTKNRSSQDPLNFPIKLNNRVAGLVGVVSDGDNRPTEQAYRVREELYGLIDVELKKLNALLDEDLARFNEAANQLKVPLIYSGK